MDADATIERKKSSNRRELWHLREFLQPREVLVVHVVAVAFAVTVLESHLEFLVLGSFHEGLHWVVRFRFAVAVVVVAVVFYYFVVTTHCRNGHDCSSWIDLF